MKVVVQQKSGAGMVCVELVTASLEMQLSLWFVVVSLMCLESYKSNAFRFDRAAPVTPEDDNLSKWLR